MGSLSVFEMTTGISDHAPFREFFLSLLALVVDRGASISGYFGAGI